MVLFSEDVAQSPGMQGSEVIGAQAALSTYFVWAYCGFGAVSWGGIEGGMCIWGEGQSGVRRVRVGWAPGQGRDRGSQVGLVPFQHPDVSRLVRAKLQV
jgi:hypothetical protein